METLVLPWSVPWYSILVNKKSVSVGVLSIPWHQTTVRDLSWLSAVLTLLPANCSVELLLMIHVFLSVYTFPTVMNYGIRTCVCNGANEVWLRQRTCTACWDMLYFVTCTLQRPCLRSKSPPVLLCSTNPSLLCSTINTVQERKQGATFPICSHWFARYIKHRWKKRCSPILSVFFLVPIIIFSSVRMDCIWECTY